MELIDKAALVAELNKRISNYWSDSENTVGIYPYALEEVIKYVDTLEVKEVDLDSNIKAYLTNHFNVYEDGVLQSKKSSRPLSTYDIIKVAKYFFELGIRQSNYNKNEEKS